MTSSDVLDTCLSVQLTQAADELLADEKERAEHLMLVDLGRNDLGRVCDYGTVHVPNMMYIERYSHVMHIVLMVVLISIKFAD